MNRGSCVHEAAVTKAASSGLWPESLRAHAEECAHCRGIVHAARWMQSLAQGGEKDADSADAKLLWWRAQLAERRARAEKTRGLLGWLEIVSGAAVPVMLAGWVVWHWYAIQAVAARSLIGLWPEFALAAVSFSALAPALLFLAAISLAYPLFGRE
jgi:hypothetical protein